MSDTSTNNKRIVKNTLVLYVRMVFLMAVNLYMSRLVLKALGVEDYGIYNVVGGFVTMFSILSGALSNAISRFITFELGRKDLNRLKLVFSSSVTVQIIIALGIVLLAEVIGVWFLNVKMNIPTQSVVAANWVFQCSLMTFAVNLVSIPYNACIIAHERMTAFAYISILEVLLKLCVVLFLFFTISNRLVIYAVLLFGVALLVRIIYGVYCSHHFEECRRYRFSFDHKLIKEMVGLASWNFLGASGSVLNSHGVNLLMNIFFGVGVNAARGLAVQVNTAVTQFVSSFTTAVNPQITKLYANGDKKYMLDLVYASSKYSFFLMLLIAMPIIVETPFFLQMWLGEVPEHTILFVRLTLIAALISTLSSALYTLALATGDIKKYQIVVGSLSLSCFVLTYACYKMGLGVEYAYYVYIVINLFILFGRLFILQSLAGLSMSDFAQRVMLRAAGVCLPVFLISYFCHLLFPLTTIIDSCIVSFVSIATTLLAIATTGLTISEKQYLFKTIKKKIL